VDITPLTKVVATGIVAFVPSEAIVLDVVEEATLKLVATLVSLEVLRAMAATWSSDITPHALVVAAGVDTLLPSLEFIMNAVALAVYDRLVLTLVAFAVLRVIASTIDGVITPATLVPDADVATGIIASFPVDEVIVLAVVVPEMAKLVATFASAAFNSAAVAVRAVVPILISPSLKMIKPAPLGLIFILISVSAPIA
tara:strand:- start:81 stop:674 length:594 start_codon:yes stop_codon:yes gene_type:complete